MRLTEPQPPRPAPPPPAECLERFYARDRTSDGRFVVGVVTTGIYCLPSCAARKPRRENVRFFADEGEAQAAGLRACKRCRPDRFYRRLDPDRDLVLALADEVRADPAAFPDVASLVRAGGVGATKLTRLFREHWHVAPAAFLLDARLRAAARALERRGAGVLEAGLAAGFESSSAFHGNFRRRTGLSPGAWRDLGSAPRFALRLPPGWRADECLAVLGRGDGRSERAGARGFVKALVLAGRPARLEVELARGEARCTVASPRGRLGRAGMVAAHRAAVRLLGLAAEPEAFERRARREPLLRPLVAARPGLRVPLSADLFEACVWVVVGQQVNLAFAAACRDALIARCGQDAGDGLLAHPTPSEVARLDVADLLALRFSRRKAEYLIDLARSIAAGQLDLEGLAERSASEARERLTAVRGLGPWSVEYVLMRGIGLEDCAPAGDAGLSLALQRLERLEHRPDERETAERLARFAPHRSLACFHLWRSLSSEAPSGDPT